MNRIGIGLFATVLVALCLPLAATADPIQDNMMNPYKAGWYPNVFKDKLLSCPEACKAHVAAQAEYEASAAPKTQRTFVCKVPVKTPVGAAPLWLYGNQFDNTPVCYYNDANRVSKAEKFYCLCVSPLRDIAK